MYKFKKILGLVLGVLLLHAANITASSADVNATVPSEKANMEITGITVSGTTIHSTTPITITRNTRPSAISDIIVNGNANTTPTVIEDTKLPVLFDIIIPNRRSNVEAENITIINNASNMPVAIEKNIMLPVSSGSQHGRANRENVVDKGSVPIVDGLPVPGIDIHSLSLIDINGLPIVDDSDINYFPEVASNQKVEIPSNPRMPLPSLENRINGSFTRDKHSETVSVVNNSSNIVIPSNNQKKLDIIPLLNLGIRAEDNVILNHLKSINWNNEDFTLKWQQSVEDSREQNPWRFKFGYAPYVITGKKSVTNLDKINVLDSSYVKNRYTSSILDGYWYTGISYELQSNLIARFNFVLNSLHNIMYTIDPEGLMPGYAKNVLAKKYSYLVNTALDYNWESYLKTHLSLAYINHLYYKYDFKEYLANLHHITGQISLKFNDIELYNVTVMNRLNFRSGMHIADANADKQYYPYLGFEYQTGPKFAINIPTGWLNFIPYFLVNIPNTLNLEHYNFIDKIDYGFGLKFLITSLNRWDLNLDYDTYINHSGFVSSQFNIGFTINF